MVRLVCRRIFFYYANSFAEILMITSRAVAIVTGSTLMAAVETRRARTILAQSKTETRWARSGKRIAQRKQFGGRDMMGEPKFCPEFLE